MSRSEQERRRKDNALTGAVTGGIAGALMIGGPPAVIAGFLLGALFGNDADVE